MNKLQEASAKRAEKLQSDLQQWGFKNKAVLEGTSAAKKKDLLARCDKMLEEAHTLVKLSRK
eukprot:5946807-Alexandrium_andersonii.AAC.1